MPSVPFPLSSTPGLRPGEGEGRVVNGYNVKEGDTVYNRRCPGLEVYVATGGTGNRGMIDLNGTIYVAYSDGVSRITPDGFVFPVGTIPGATPVTWARNNKVAGGASTPDLIAARTNGGVYVVTDSSVTTYSLPGLPATAVNSVEFLDGFFIFTTSDGRIFASDLNSVTVNALSFATAESKPDQLLRGIVHAGVFYAMGTETIEPWVNVGGSPFPLQRASSVLPVGLRTATAIAGFEVGWDHGPYFVAHDLTVRALEGYNTRKVSTPDVEAFIAASSAPTLEACVYTVKGNAFWALSSNIGTWVYNVTTGLWHQQVSTGTNRWRGNLSVKSAARWVVGDKLSGNLLTISDSVRTEAGQPVTWTIESSPLKEYPARIAVPSLFADFTEADGVSVDVSWSHDGGKSWSNPLTCSLGEADRGSIRVNRLGLTTQHGLRVRFSSSSTGDFSFMGASVPVIQGRAP